MAQMEPTDKGKRSGSMSPAEREEYEVTLLLERLESLLEEMEELGVHNRVDVERQVEALRLKLTASGGP